MNAYLIDPHSRSVSAVEYSGNYKEIYTLIDADCFDVARISSDGSAELWIDDEGNYSKGGNQAYFIVEGFAQPLAGKALCLGSIAGESTAPRCTLEELQGRVIWVSEADALALREINTDERKAWAIANGYEVIDCGEGTLVLIEGGKGAA